MGNYTLSLSPPHVWALLEALWIDFSVCALMYRLYQPPNWQVGSVRLQISIDGLSFNYSGLSPWDLRPPYARSPIFCINKDQITSSKLIRTGIEVLLLLYCVIVYYSGIKKLWRQYLWCNALHGWMMIVKCLWGIICVIYHWFCWLIVGLEGRRSLLLG